MAQTSHSPTTEPEFDHDNGDPIKLLDYLFSKDRRQNLQNNPLAIIEAIDQFAKNEQLFVMKLDSEQGILITEEIKKVRPKSMVELGAYIGYSAILFGNTLRETSGGTLYSIEYDPFFAGITMAIVKLAGLQDTIKVEIGTSSERLQYLHKNGSLKGIDLLFMDHYKPAYIADLKLCEDLGLIGPGSVLVADNVIFPGSPLYLQYVRKSPEEKRKDLRNPMKLKITDLSKSQRIQSNQLLDEAIPIDFEGNPDLVYETKLHEGYRVWGDTPDAVAISRCVGRTEAPLMTTLGMAAGMSS